MADEDDFEGRYIPSNGEDADDKEEIAAGLHQQSVFIDEDQSRSTLHTGAPHEGSVLLRAIEPSSSASTEVPTISFVEGAAAPYTKLSETSQNAGFADAQDVSTIGKVSILEGEEARVGREALEPQSFQNSAQLAPQTGSERVSPSSSEPAASLNGPGSHEDGPKVNNAPQGMQLSTASVAENASGAVIGEITVVDPDAGDSHSFMTSDPRFEVVDGHLQLAPGVALDHEAAAQIEVEVTVTDSAGATLTQSFTVEVADVNEGPAAITLSGSSVAENASGAVIGEITVVDPDTGDSHSFMTSDPRFEVVDGHLQLAPGVALDHEAAAQIEVEVTVTDSAGATLTQSFTVEVAEIPDLKVSSGFHTQFFDVDHAIRKLDDIDWDVDPTHQEVSSDINYANSGNSFWEGGSRDTFGVQVNGNIEVSEAGSFEFHLGGDDGAVLFVDGKPVIDNDGLHGFRTRSGEIDLEPGTHHIEVRYFENHGSAGLKLEWEGPGLEGRELVSAPELESMQTISGVPVTLNVGLDSGVLPEGGTLMIEGLPPGTVVQAGEASVVVDETGSADITQWDTALLNVTPPVDFIGAVPAELTISVPTANGGIVSSHVDIAFDVGEALVEGPVVSLAGGFSASYFDVDHSLKRLDDINWDDIPTHQESVAEINYANSSDSFWEGGSRDTFGAKLEGQITIEEGGSYTFYAGGDDGVVLYIDGEPVIDNDGLHGYRTRTGEVELEPGSYDIELRYFENTGHAGLKLEWEGPGTNGREFVRADPQTAIEENGTWDVGIEVSSGNAGAGVELLGLPADTILISGDESAVADGGAVDLTGWDLGQLEISPPLGFEGVIDAEFQVTGTAFNGAEVTSSQTFSLKVGDVDAAVEMAELPDEILWSASTDVESAQQSWLGDVSDMDDDMSGPDVMAEPIIEHGMVDISDMSVETYERVDW